MARTFWAPGRVNLIGEHTDYAGGLVLPIAIDLGITLSVEPAETISLVSRGHAVEVAASGAGETSGWGRYVAAVAAELDALGRPPVGIAGAVEADLPSGAGLGSSAALQVAIAVALCGVADFEVEPTELALACRRAEQRAVGVHAGILDQAASLLGRDGHALFLDCESLEHRWIPLPAGLAILVIDCGERHRHEDSAYAARRRELEAGDVKRVRHVTSENRRVLQAVAALEQEDVEALGPILRAGHESLRDDFEVSTSTLDTLVDLAYENGALAARLTGGGFGGSIVALARSESADAVLDAVVNSAGGAVTGRAVRSSNGAGEL